MHIKGLETNNYRRWNISEKNFIIIITIIIIIKIYF